MKILKRRKMNHQKGALDISQVMERKVNVDEVFSSIARRYDLLNSVLSFRMVHGWRKKTIEICELEKQDKVLDLFCGTGRMVAQICKKVGRHNEVVGLDFNEEMLKVGHEWLNTELSGHKFNLVQGDALKLPFPDKSFDCITMAFGIRNVADKELALSEGYRVLKPDGRLVCLELSWPQAPIIKQVFGFYFKHILPWVGYLGTGDKRAYHYLTHSIHGFMTKKELKAAFEKVGFRETFYKSLSGGTASIHYGRKK